MNLEKVYYRGGNEKIARMIKIRGFLRSSRFRNRQIQKPKKTVQVKRKVRMASTLHTFQLNNKYCDITLLSADGARKINAHRVVLAAKMNDAQLEAIFANQKEMKTTMDAVTLQAVVNYCYTNVMTVESHEQMFKLLQSANRYQIDDLIEQCKMHLNRAVSMENILVFWALSKLHVFPEMHEFCWNTINDSFMEIVKKPSFNELGSSRLLEILCSDCLHSPNEEAVLGAFLKWITKSYDMDLDRNIDKVLAMDIHIDLSFILSLIRFPQMSMQFFTKYAKRVCEKFNREDLVAEYFGRSITWVDSSMNNRMTPRVNLTSLATVGLPASAGQSKIRRFNANVAYHDDYVAVCRGKNISMEQLDHLKTNRVYEFPSNEYRCKHASVFLDHDLYVAGGMKSGKLLNSVERYDFIKRCWTKVKPMLTERCNFSMVILHGLIYAIGGESKRQILDSVEIYDPARNIWMNGPPMILRRKDASVAVHKNKIYAIGGSQNFLTGKTVAVERFDFHKNNWTIIASLSAPRIHMAHFTHNHRLGVAGGFGSNGYPVYYTELYDEKKNLWTRFEPPNKVSCDGQTQSFPSLC